MEYSGHDFEIAKASLGKRSAQVAEGRILDIVKASKITFNELSAWYLKQTSVTRLKSFNRVVIGIKNFNLIFGDSIVSKITKEDVVRYQEKRLNDTVQRHGCKQAGTRKISQQTVDTEIMLVKAMVNYGFMEDHIDGTALKVFKRIKKQVRPGANARTRTITSNEFERIINHAPDHIRAFMVIGLNTGMRLGEIRQLRWSNIDSEMKFIRLHSDDTKEKRPKVIPINHNVRDILASQKRYIDHDYVLTYHGAPISTPGGIRHGFQSAIKAAGILHGRDVQGGMIFHDIRRTVKSNMLKAGIDKVHRDMILGHSLQGMDKHYMVSSDSELERAMGIYSLLIDSKNW
jgi:integrase